MDGAGAQVTGEFYKKLRIAGTLVKEIRVVFKSSGMVLVGGWLSSKTPERIQDHCLVMEACACCLSLNTC